MVSSSNALLYCFFLISFLVYLRKQGSSAGRGQSPVEWGGFPSVCLFIHPDDQSEGSDCRSKGSEDQLKRFKGKSED